MNQIRRRLLGFLAAVPFVGTAIASKIETKTGWMSYEELGTIAFNPKAVVKANFVEELSLAGFWMDLGAGLNYAERHGRFIVINHDMAVDLISHVSKYEKAYEAFTPAPGFMDLRNGLFGDISGVEIYTDAFKHPEAKLFRDTMMDYHPIHKVFNGTGLDEEKFQSRWVVPNAESMPKVLEWLATPWVEPIARNHTVGSICNALGIPI